MKELRAMRREIMEIARKHGALDIRVFGSVARGEARSSSDLDLVVEFESGRSLFDHGGLAMDLQEVLGCSVDILSTRGMRERLRARVEAEAVRL